MTQAFNLSQLANNLNTSGQLDATDGLVNAVPVANGGTGASSASGARTNLGLDYTTIATQIIGSIYPVGSIYTNATNSTNPATLLGFGTWAAFGSARVLIGDGGGFTAGSTGGSADAIVVSHTHSITDSGHTHVFDGGNFTASGNIFQATSGSLGSAISATSTGSIRSATTGITGTNSTGSSGTNANLQPYVVVYMWRRTA